MFKYGVDNISLKRLFPLKSPKGVRTEIKTFASGK